MKNFFGQRRAVLGIGGWALGLGVLGVGALGTMAFSVQANSVDSLAQFMQQISSGRADFTQVVTSPSRAGQPTRAKTSSGRFEFQRPGQFRFDYLKPFVQTLVADGQTLWLHDLDLNQVTAQSQAQVLGSTPAALLTAASDLRALQADFKFTPEPDQGGLQWVRAMPQSPDGQIRAVMVGLRVSPSGPELAVLDVQDSLGQRSVLTFTGFESNPTLPAQSFVFKAPPGADIIRP